MKVECAALYDKDKDIFTDTGSGAIILVYYKKDVVRVTTTLAVGE
jgi:hypothetical protein